MTPGVHNFTVYQGSKLEKQFAWSTGSAPPVPVNLTGYTARAQFRTTIDAPTPIISLTTENDRIVIDELEGTFTLVLTSVDTAALAFNTAVYDVELIPASGEDDAFRIVQGTVTLDKEVTRI